MRSVHFNCNYSACFKSVHWFGRHIFIVLNIILMKSTISWVINRKIKLVFLTNIIILFIIIYYYRLTDDSPKNITCCNFIAPFRIEVNHTFWCILQYISWPKKHTWVMACESISFRGDFDNDLCVFERKHCVCSLSPLQWSDLWTTQFVSTKMFYYWIVIPTLLRPSRPGLA